MHPFSSLLLLGTLAFNAVTGRPNSLLSERAVVKRDVDSFLATEVPYALNQVKCNIASGCNAGGVGSGLVIASPSKSDPDYFYHWTRDAALVFKAVVDRFVDSYDADLQTLIQNCMKNQVLSLLLPLPQCQSLLNDDFCASDITSQARLQTVSNPSGNFYDGSGLGEPKFNADGSQFTGSWGRPQRDGPPLRALTMITYSKWLVNNGYQSTAKDLVWPVIQNDLAYTAQYWNQTGFDLWEEVQGSSFFTIAASHRALVEGSNLAKTLGTSCSYCDSIAPQVLCFQQSFWSSSGNYALANINVNNGRSGKDTNVFVSTNQGFDPSLGCDATSFQPCSDRALASHKVVVDSFRSIYSINSDIGKGQAIAVGRYPEDTYYNGNPWYLHTLGAAEQLYNALYVWKSQGSITVTSTSLPFFQDLSSSVSTGTYASDTATYKTIYDAVMAYADGFVNNVAKYVGANGALAEQYDRNNGNPLSARDLTWSYASVLTVAARRAGVIPLGWAETNVAATSVPGSCYATSAIGAYSAAPTNPFPASQTPGSGQPTVPTSTRTTSPPAPTTTSCTPATSVAVSFNERKVSSLGQTVKIVGNIPALGNWDTNKAVALSASGYTSNNPVWSVSITFAAGQSMQYKYIVVNTDGSVTWEADPNHAYTVPTGCATQTTKSDSWQ
ncbi:glucoamylase [Apiospora marii]|uniref:glucoamylase n=1 Tax=Apiospora marii TaxID=335849 RepID=UPI00312FED05